MMDVPIVLAAVIVGLVIGDPSSSLAWFRSLPQRIAEMLRDIIRGIYDGWDVLFGP